MVSFFKDMFAKGPLLADLAEGDWSPVPAHHLAVAHSPPPGPDWVAVLRRFGEHLTDEELRIVRRQLAPL